MPQVIQYVPGSVQRAAIRGQYRAGQLAALREQEQADLAIQAQEQARIQRLEDVLLQDQLIRQRSAEAREAEAGERRLMEGGLDPATGQYVPGVRQMGRIAEEQFISEQDTIRKGEAVNTYLKRRQELMADDRLPDDVKEEADALLRHQFGLPAAQRETQPSFQFREGEVETEEGLENMLLSLDPRTGIARPAVAITEGAQGPRLSPIRPVGKGGPAGRTVSVSDIKGMSDIAQKERAGISESLNFDPEKMGADQPMGADQYVGFLNLGAQRMGQYKDAILAVKIAQELEPDMPEGLRAVLKHLNLKPDWDPISQPILDEIRKAYVKLNPQITQHEYAWYHGRGERYFNDFNSNPALQEQIIQATSDYIHAGMGRRQQLHTRQGGKIEYQRAIQNTIEMLGGQRGTVVDPQIVKQALLLVNKAYWDNGVVPPGAPIESTTIEVKKRGEEAE